MEELRTTETLDREILEDARKKAQRILKAADDTLAVQTRDWEKKTRQAVESIQKNYEERIAKTGEEILARLPLDKRRLRSETAETLLVKAMDDFLRSLKREHLLAILERDLFGRLEDCAGEDAGDASGTGRKPDLNSPSQVIYSGLNLSEARALIGEALAVLSQKNGGLSRVFTGGSAADWNFREDIRVHEFPSLVIDTQAMKITSSVETAAAALLKDKRAELAAALLGEGVLND